MFRFMLKMLPQYIFAFLKYNSAYAICYVLRLLVRLPGILLLQ